MFYEKQETFKTIKDLTYFIGNVGVDIKNENENREDIEIASYTYNDAKYIRKEMQINNQELYFMYLYFEVFGKTKNEVDFLLDKLEATLSSNGILVRKANFRQEQLFKSCLPFFQNSKDLKEVGRRNILTNGICATYPFISNSVFDEKGILIGNNMYDDTLIFIDRFNKEKYKNANLCVFGTSGAGKSFFTKLMILRTRILGIEQYVIDPEREYGNLVKNLDGSLIKLGPSSKTFINILDIRKESLEDEENGFLITKINKLKGFFKLIISDISDENWAYLERELIRTYNQKGITFDDKTLFKENDKFMLKPIFKDTFDMPILEDLYKNIKENKNLENVAIKLYPFIYGSLSFFNKNTNVILDNKLIVFDIYELGEENLKYGMWILVDLLWDKIKKERTIKKLLYIDEIWRLIGVSSNSEVANFIYKIFKTIRKYNGGATSITQDVSDLFDLDEGSYGKCILNNSEIKSFFKLEEENILVLDKFLNLTQKEKIEIKNLKKGETLIFAGENHLTASIISSKEEKNIIENKEEL